MIVESFGINSLFASRTAVRLRHLWFLAGMILLTACQDRGGYVVLRQVTARPAETNTYLLYDISTGEAAIFDVGGPVDSLVAAIDQKGLQVKYLFSTHGHPDHVKGLPEIRDRYPQARWGVSRIEYEDMSLYAAWEEVLPPEEAASIKAEVELDPAVAEIFDFDFSRLGEPDLFLEDGEIYRLGDYEIHTYVTPGHSRGSICFHVGDALFSGDVLFQGRVGGTDHPRSGGNEAMTESVHRLYQIIPDETTVYPGHGEFTDIGTEKLMGTGIPREQGKSP